MNTNPYASPNSDVLHRLPQFLERVGAQRRIRIALLILLLPAIYNFVCFNFPADANRIELPIHSFYRAVNSVGLVGITVCIWILGLPALELFTGGCHAVFARNSALQSWKTTLYASLRRAPWFALGGAFLWAMWVAAFYQLGIGFYVVSVPLGIASHLLAAGLYLPLFYRWYEIDRSRATQVTT